MEEENKCLQCYKEKSPKMPIALFSSFEVIVDHQFSLLVFICVKNVSRLQNIHFSKTNKWPIILNIENTKNARNETQTSYFWKLSSNGLKFLPVPLHAK